MFAAEVEILILIFSLVGGLLCWLRQGESLEESGGLVPVLVRQRDRDPLSTSRMSGSDRGGPPGRLPGTSF